MKRTTILDSEDSSVLSQKQENRASLAFASPDYPVSPGDIYQLVYYRSYEPVRQNCMVEADLSINLGVFGRIDASGLTFSQLQKQVQELVESSYRESSPSLFITSLGSFQVLLTGEVDRVRYLQIDGLTRLEDLAGRAATEFTGIRDVELRYPDGSVERSDLFRFRRDGERSENPFVRPGVELFFPRAERIVSLKGEVFRPGRYQLLEGEGLNELLEYYGGGLKPNADSSSLEVKRLGSGSSEAQALYLDLDASPEAGFDLEHQDIVHVASKLRKQPTAFFEGAVLEDREDPAKSSGEGPRYNRMRYRFSEGEKLSEAVENLAEHFLMESDLARAYILRNGMEKPLPVDIEQLILYRDVEDPELEDGDRVIVPFRQLFVTVSGGVKKPGSYPYVQGKHFSYYLALAGGLDKDEHYWGTNPKITDGDGEKVDDDAVIGLDYRIHFPNTNPFRIITPVTSIATTVLSSILLFR